MIVSKEVLLSYYGRLLRCGLDKPNAIKALSSVFDLPTSTVREVVEEVSA